MIKKIFFTIFAIAVVISLYFTAYLPLAKSQRYIDSIIGASSIQTLDDFYANYDRVLKFYSPTGQEEAIRFAANDMLQAVANDAQQENFDRAVVAYIEPYLYKDNVRHLLMAAQMHFTLWRKYGNQNQDFLAAEHYYTEALAIGPKLPPILYGLFDLYARVGEKEKTQLVGGRILELWDDQTVRGMLSGSN